MKVLRMMSMMVVATTLTIGVCGCSSDDDENVVSSVPSETDYAKSLSGHWMNVEGQDNFMETMSFNAKSTGSIAYEYTYDTDDDQYGVLASGTYTVNGTSLVMSFNNVSVYTETGSDSYRGFTHKKNRTVTYTIQSCSGKNLVLKDNSGNTLKMEKYADLK